MPLTGRWQVFYGEDEEQRSSSGPWDVASVPAGVWRGFRNAGDEEAYLLVVVGGTDAGRLTWAPKVLEEAAGGARSWTTPATCRPTDPLRPRGLPSCTGATTIRGGALSRAVPIDIATEVNDSPGAAQPGTVPSLLAAAAAGSPTAPALLAPERRALDYAGLAEHVGELAASLSGLGLGRADRVAVVLPRRPRGGHRVPRRVEPSPPARR